MAYDEDDPVELRDPVPSDPPRGLPVWVRLTALLLIAAVLLFYVASYFS